MKKIITIILCLVCLFSVSGCISSFMVNEQEVYNKTVHEFLNALDKKDSDAIYNLFSVSVQKNCGNLKEKIEELISIYSGPTEKIGDLRALGGEATIEHGDSCKSAYTFFPILSDGNYFWIYLELMYENSFDENKIGITQLDFYTADAYYDFWSSDSKQEVAIGLNIFNKKVDHYNIISINNYPYNYRPTEILDIEEVKSFFETSTSYVAFEKKFGTTACEDGSYIYSLADQNGESLYLSILCVDDQIMFSEILSNFSYVDTVFHEEESGV